MPLINHCMSYSYARVLDRIEITTPPTTNEYWYDEARNTFDPAGMVVTAYFDDGYSCPVTEYSYSPMGLMPWGTTEIIVTYNDGGVSRTAAQAITQNPGAVYGVTTWRTSGNYVVGASVSFYLREYNPDTGEWDDPNPGTPTVLLADTLNYTLQNANTGAVLASGVMGQDGYTYSITFPSRYSVAVQIFFDAEGYALSSQ